MVNCGSKLLPLSIILSALVSGCSDHTSKVEETLEVVMFQATPEGNGPSVGKMIISYANDNDVAQGVSLQPALHDLPPGNHGFHVHENPSCEPGEQGGQQIAALAAGSHYDPEKTGHHEGPEGHGHLGDLPALRVDDQGNADTPVKAPRLSLPELRGHSLVIHAGSDNYSDTPPLGGGGARIACGIIP